MICIFHLRRIRFPFYYTGGYVKVFDVDLINNFTYMALKNQIQEELGTAMKAGDETKVSTLRMLKAAILKFEVSGKEKTDATDEVILDIITKEIKQRRDSIEQFKAGNRFEMAEKEEKELEILMAYMPPQMSDDELKKIVIETIEETGASTDQGIGRVIGAVMAKVKGQADGGRVKTMVNALLV